MNSERIGQAAGAVWTRLHNKGVNGVAFADLKKIPGYTADETLAGLGWLAREGKLTFKTDATKKCVVSLVEEEIFATT